MRRLALIALFLLPCLAQAGEIAGDYSWPLQPGLKASDLPLTSYPTLGKSWVAIKDLVPSGSGGVEYIAKVGSGRLVAVYSGSPGGIYYSTDLGLTWTQSTIATTTTYASFYRVAGDGQGTVIAGTYTSSGGVIVRSTDYGVNFSVVKTGIVYARDVVYMGGNTWLVGTHRSAAVKLYRSTDNGVTWNTYTTGDIGLYGTCNTMLKLEGSNVLMKTSGDTGAYNAIWTSADAGQSWTQIATGSAFVGLDVQTSPSGIGSYLGNGVIVLPMQAVDDGSNRSFVYRSTDYGHTWTLVKYVNTVGSGFDCSANLGNGRVLVAGTDDGSAGAQTTTVYQSVDYGQTWDILYVIPDHHVYSIVNMGDGTALLGTWSDAYIYRSKGL